MARMQDSTSPQQEPARGTDGFLDRHAWVVIVLVYALARLIYFAMGVRFVTNALEDHWQFIDIPLMKDRLLESLWYLHSQPPLMNLVCGLAVKAGAAGMIALNLLFVGLGLTAALCLYRLLRRLGLGVGWAFAIELVFLFNPTMVLYENYLFYTQPVASLLCLAAWSLDRFLGQGRRRWAAVFFWCLAAIVLTRSPYHLAYLVGMAVLVPLLCPAGLRRRALAMALIPVLAATSWYVKNWAVFGQFSASSWLGMSLAKTWNDYVSPEEVKALQARGELSVVAHLRPFRTVEEYQKVIPLPPPTGKPVLDQTIKTDKQPNYNHPIYIQASRLHLADAKVILKTHPGAYLRNQLDSWGSYFRPASEYGFLGEQNLRLVAPVETVYKRAFYLQPSSELPDKALKQSDRAAYLWGKVKNMSITIILGTAFVVLYIPFQAWRLWRSGQRRQAAVMLFLWLNVVFVALTANALEVGENHRYRHETEPLWTVLLFAGLGDLVRRWRGRKSAPPAPAGVS